MSCPTCGAVAPEGANFCEECGTPLSAAAPVAASPEAVLGAVAALDAEPSPIDDGGDLGSGPISAVTSRSAGAGGSGETRRACLGCGGQVGPDGYCEVCGTKALSERDHFRQSPAPWVAGVCDKGIRHHRNEDAMALLASPDGAAADRRAVLLVLDGVSNTDDSQAGSLAGAEAALEVLRRPLPRALGTPDSRWAAVTRTMGEATEAAQARVVEAAPETAANPASATYVVAVLEGSQVVVANIGDSRGYWLPDEGDGVQLTVDDSAAQAQMAAGVPREIAETSPQAHAITKWLGRDSEDVTPRVAELELTGAGWLLVCSDGLWNYASEPARLAEQVGVARAAGATDPAALALALTAFANACGGQDNITVTLARVEPLTGGQNAPTDPPVDPSTDLAPRESDG